MQIVAQFDPSKVMSDSFTIQNSPGATMLIYNESSISLQIVLLNGYSAYLPAYVGMLFPAIVGNVTISWLQYAVLNSSRPPLSQVTVELFDCGETIPGTYPVAMNRLTNVGNSVITG